MWVRGLNLRSPLLNDSRCESPNGRIFFPYFPLRVTFWSVTSVVSPSKKREPELAGPSVVSTSLIIQEPVAGKELSIEVTPEFELHLLSGRFQIALKVSSSFLLISRNHVI